MNDTPFARARKLVARMLLAGCLGGALWFLAPGIPLMRGPHASAATQSAGQELFDHVWTVNDSLAGGDGVGPVFNATSCTACHFQGGVGGAGSIDNNVNAYEAWPTQQNPALHAGLIHAAAITDSLHESVDMIHRLYPVIPGGTRLVGGCTVKFEDFDPVRFQSVNTPALFGAGWIDRLSAKSIRHNGRRQMFEGTAKEFQLDFSSIPAGRPRILSDGRVGKFGWKAQFATLQEFVAAACANELGLGNPLLEQARPLGQPEYPSVKRDMSKRQFRDLVAFVDTLPRPMQIEPTNPHERRTVQRGESLFQSIGCAYCHTPDLGGVKGVYSDFLLHKIDDPIRNSGYRVEQVIEVPVPSDHPAPEEWKTPALWGVADSAPYFHDGGSTTLHEAILRHAGHAARVTEAFRKLAPDDQQAIVAFLMTLKAPPDAPQSPAAIERAFAAR